MSSSRQLFASSPRKKAKSTAKSEKIARQNKLMTLANYHADECNNMLSTKTNVLMKEYREWLDVSELGFFGPMLSVTSFFMHRAKTIVEDKKMNQPVKVWVEIIAYPGCKKTVIYKLFNDNLERIKSSYQRNLIPCNLIDAIYGGGTTEAWKKALCDGPLTDGSSLILCNEFNSFLDDLDKYSSSKGDKSLLCEMFDGMSIRRHTKCDGDMSVDKTNVSITGMIQPDFALPNMEEGNDSSGLYRRFFCCAPKVGFSNYEDSSILDHDSYFKPSAVWVVIVCDEVIGKSDVEYKMSTAANAIYNEFYNKKASECRYYTESEKQHLIANASKSRDLVLRVAPIVQVIEMSLEFLNTHPAFSYSRRNDFMQPLLPAANIIQPNSIEKAISIVEAFQKQWDILSGETTNDEEEGSLKECIIKDILLFKSNHIKGASILTKRNNPYAGMKHSTIEYESMFKYLDEIKIGKVETKVAMNNSPFLVFTKISYEALISDVNIMDKWPKYVSIKDYDKIYKDDAKRAEVATATNTNELSEDPIQE
jgi:hypothetical protein